MLTTVRLNGTSCNGIKELINQRDSKYQLNKLKCLKILPGIVVWVEFKIIVWLNADWHKTYCFLLKGK